MSFWYYCILAVIGFSSGTLIAGGVFAIIVTLGIVPRLAQRTGTIQYIPLYEDAIVIGGIFGTSTMLIDYYLPIGRILVGFLGFCLGVFVGCLAVALAEILNVMPIFMRRSRITKGIPVIVCGLALGKVLGSLLYFLIKGFYVM